MCVEEFGLYCQVPSPHLGDPARGEPPDWTDGKDLGRSTGSYGSRREDGGVRILGLGLNPEVGPARGSWSRERSEVDDGGGTSEREELKGTDESRVGGTLADYPNAETQRSY